MIYATQQGLLPHDSPTRNVKLPTVEETEVNMWSIQDFNQFISDSKKIADCYGKLNQYHGYTGQYLKMIEFIRYTGCRVYEACGLTWDNFNADKNELSFVKTVKRINGKPFPFVEGMKTKKSKRTILLTSQATNILEELFANRKVIDFENPYIFNLNGKPFMDTTLSRIFAKLRDELNMPVPFTLRDNRKIFITEALIKGVPIHDVADYCGTSLQEISNTYARSTEVSQLELVKVMSANG